MQSYLRAHGHDLWLETIQTSQNKMFTTERDEASRAHVNAHRIPLTNQIKQRTLARSFVPFNVLVRFLSNMVLNWTESGGGAKTT